MAIRIDALVCAREPRRGSQMRIATTTQLIDAGDVVRSFLEYHRAIGFDHAFLFFDDPADPTYDALVGRPDVTCIRAGPELLAEQRVSPRYAENASHFGTEVMARQNVNAAVAIERARAMGIDWLLHIDIDELMLAPQHDARPFFLNLQETKHDQVVLLNHEAVPETEEVENYFRDVSLFKFNPSCFSSDDDYRTSFWKRRGWYFNGYPIGKAAVRVNASPMADGPHRFIATSGEKLRTTYSTEPCILHYQTCGLQRLIQKYRKRGRFGDKWFGLHPITLPFHLRSRDLVHDHSADEVAEFYRTHVQLRGVDIANEIERGRMFRAEIPPELFGAE